MSALYKYLLYPTVGVVGLAVLNFAAVEVGKLFGIEEQLVDLMLLGVFWIISMDLLRSEVRAQERTELFNQSAEFFALACMNTVVAGRLSVAIYELVTGSGAGLGSEAVRVIAGILTGYRVYLIVRNAGKSEGKPDGQ